MRAESNEPVEIATDLVLQLTNILEPGVPFLRKELVDRVTSSLPKDPETRLLVYHAELRPEFDVPWHIHNGPLLNIITRGEVIFQMNESEYYYKAGDVFLEPVGVVHRAYVPDSESGMPLTAIGIQFTPPGRDHIVPLEGVNPGHRRPRTAPPGPFEPLPDLTAKLPFT